MIKEGLVKRTFIVCQMSDKKKAFVKCFADDLSIMLAKNHNDDDDRLVT